MVFRRGLCQNFSELKAYDGFVGAIAIDNKGNVHHLDSHPMVLLVLMEIVLRFLTRF
jgi:hypothetical protein